MNILLVHQNYPGQFSHLGPALVLQGHCVKALRLHDKRLSSALAGVDLVQWAPSRGTCKQAHPWVHDMETKLIRGEAAGHCAEQLRREGWQPDVIVGHPGWGDMLFLHHIWPGIPQLHFLEFMYSDTGLDVDFDPEFYKNDWQTSARVTAKNAPNLLSLQVMNQGMSPTRFQANTFPSWCQRKIAVIHDGIDTSLVKPNANAIFELGGRVQPLRVGAPIITFVNRNLEPYRGYHRLMRALPAIQRHCPEAICVLVGGDDVSYGSRPEGGKSWKQIYLDEMASQLDMSRVHLPGRLPYSQYLSLLQVSACHVYFTYPFVLGWSCLEAMAAGCYVVGSDTAPVQEVISDGVEGRLVNFFDEDGLVEAVVMALKEPDRTQPFREAARARILRKYDLKKQSLPQQLSLVEALAERNLPLS